MHSLFSNSPREIVRLISEYCGFDDRLAFSETNKQVKEDCNMPNQWLKKHFPDEYEAVRKASNNLRDINYSNAWQDAIKKHYLPLRVRLRRLLILCKEKDFSALTKERPTAEELLSLITLAGANILNREFLQNYYKIGFEDNKGDPIAERVFAVLCDQPAELYDCSVVDGIGTDYGYSPLQVAILRGNLAWVSKICKTPEFIHFSDHLNMALHLAAKKGQLDIVRFLCLQSGININSKNYSELEPSAVFENERVATTPLYTAAAAKHWDVVNFLIQQPDIDIYSQVGRYLDNPFTIAAKYNQLTLLQSLIEINLNNVSYSKTILKNVCDSLIVAIRYNQLELCRYLIQCLRLLEKQTNIPKKDINKYIGTTITIAIHFEQFECLQFLFGEFKYFLESFSQADFLDADNKTIFDHAVEQDIQFIKYLLTQFPAAVISMNTKSLLYLAALQGRWDSVSYLMQQEAVIKPSLQESNNLEGLLFVHLARFNGRWDEIKDHYASVQDEIHDRIENGESLLFAAKNNLWSSVRSLVKDPVLYNPLRLPNGSTLLHVAVEANQLDELEYLCTLHHRVNGRDMHFMSPLHLAARYGYVKLAECLLRHGADIEAKAKEGFTPLLIAAENNHASMIKFLGDAGANLNATTSRGYTALHFVAFQGNTSALDYLCVNPTVNLMAKTQYGHLAWQLAIENDPGLECFALYLQPEVIFYLLDNYKDVSTIFNEEQKATLRDGLWRYWESPSRYNRADILINYSYSLRAKNSMELNQALIINMLYYQCKNVIDLTNQTLAHPAFSNIFYHGKFRYYLMQFRERAKKSNLAQLPNEPLKCSYAIKL